MTVIYITFLPKTGVYFLFLAKNIHSKQQVYLMTTSKKKKGCKIGFCLLYGCQDLRPLIARLNYDHKSRPIYKYFGWYLHKCLGNSEPRQSKLYTKKKKPNASACRVFANQSSLHWCLFWIIHLVFMWRANESCKFTASGLTSPCPRGSWDLNRSPIPKHFSFSFFFLLVTTTEPQNLKARGGRGSDEP